MKWNLIAKTGFYSSFIGYLIFILAEYARHGFVSFIFSPHLFLIAILVFGLWWGLEGNYQTNKFSGLFSWLGLLLASLILFIIVWKEGEVFGDSRVIAALIAFCLPAIVYKLLSSFDEPE